MNEATTQKLVFQAFCCIRYDPNIPVKCVYFTRLNDWVTPCAKALHMSNMVFSGFTSLKYDSYEEFSIFVIGWKNFSSQAGSDTMICEDILWYCF